MLNKLLIEIPNATSDIKNLNKILILLILTKQVIKKLILSLLPKFILLYYYV